MRQFAVLLLLAASPVAAADRPLSAEEFDAYTRGKTLYYGAYGSDYGVEEYLDGRRVRWAFLGDECIEGVWYPQGNHICFNYEDREGDQCWQFFMSDGQLTAQVMGEEDGLVLYEVTQSREPMICLGPQIGV